MLWSSCRQESLSLIRRILESNTNSVTVMRVITVCVTLTWTPVTLSLQLSCLYADQSITLISNFGHQAANWADIETYKRLFCLYKMYDLRFIWSHNMGITVRKTHGLHKEQGWLKSAILGRGSSYKAEVCTGDQPELPLSSKICQNPPVRQSRTPPAVAQRSTTKKC